MSSGTRSKILIFVIAVLLIANIAILVFFKGPAASDKPPVERPRLGLTVMLKDQVGFSPEQMTALEQFKIKHREKVRPLFDSLKSAKTNLYNFVDDTNVPDSTASNASAAVGNWQGKLDLAFYKHFQNVRNLCTAEQKIKFDSLFPGFMQKMITAPPFGRPGNPSKDSIPAKQNR